MKTPVQAFTYCFLAMIFAGCAGYNTAMFTTKSNAGLDLDMKPPTAEISIARKEGVVEPAFEAGATPPVLASFHPRTGFGGAFKNYFVGVNQTFAGGDAAKTMAILYDQPTFLTGDDGIFNSALPLGTPIQSTNPLIAPAAPGKIRPFVFATDTMLGLKVAWNGAGGQFPDTVKAGFNRKEFAWAPITMSTDKKTVKMPSFLASIESQISGGADTNASTNVLNQAGGIESIQYFATGDAASRLARQKAVRDAMLARLDPSYNSNVNFHNSVILRNMLFAMSSTFQQLTQDPIAQGYFKKLGALSGIDIPASFQSAKPPLFFYSFAGPPPAGGNAVLNKVTTLTVLGGGVGPTVNTGDINSYISDLENSIANITSAQNQIKAAGALKFSTDGGAQTDITPANTLEMQTQFGLQNAQIDHITQQISTNSDIQSAYQYFGHLTKQ